MGIPIRLCRASAPFSLAPSVLCLISFRFLMPYTVVNVASANPIIPSVLLLILGFITLPHDPSSRLLYIHHCRSFLLPRSVRVASVLC